MKWKVAIMEQWVIYSHPLDHPDHYVVRRWWVDRGEVTADPYITLADSLPEARQAVPPGLFRLPRWGCDDSVIAEVWL